MSTVEKLPVVLLAGGFGTRLGQETLKLPKPLVRIGEYPIIVHIMSLYLKQGHTDFIILGGYKCDEIKYYFQNFELNYSNIGFEYVNNTYRRNWNNPGIDKLGFSTHDWTLKILDTGLNANTAERLWRASDQILGQRFFCTYGDGLSTIDLNSLLSHHKKNKVMATLSAFHPPSRFGEIAISEDGKVKNFVEKPLMQTRVNGGFFVFEREVLQLCVENYEPLESGVLSKLSDSDDLSAYPSDDWWQMMDTPRELDILNDLWRTNSAPWLR